MNAENTERKTDFSQKNALQKARGRMAVRSAKECAYLAVFVALTIAAQLAFSLVPGVEVVTVLFVSYSFTFGWKRGMAAATAFSLLRQVVFGVYPVVLILYLVYYNGLALIFGVIGKKMRVEIKTLWKIALIACFCTVCFHLFDNLLTPIWYGYSEKATRLYFYASLPFMIPQAVCTVITVFTLFLPLEKTFTLVKKGL